MVVGGVFQFLVVPMLFLDCLSFVFVVGLNHELLFFRVIKFELRLDKVGFELGDVSD
jgi:hypothetical protein